MLRIKIASTNIFLMLSSRKTFLKTIILTPVRFHGTLFKPFNEMTLTSRVGCNLTYVENIFFKTWVCRQEFFPSKVKKTKKSKHLLLKLTQYCKTYTMLYTMLCTMLYTMLYTQCCTQRCTQRCTQCCTQYCTMLYTMLYNVKRTYLGILKYQLCHTYTHTQLSILHTLMNFG
jgi:hypothetical protein